MKIRPFRAALGLRVCALVVLAASFAPRVAAQAATAPFDVLDNIEGDNVDLVFAPVKPMVLEPGNGALWAINTHGSTVNRYVNTSGAPNKVFPVPWGPVSIEYWDRPNGLRDELLVVSRGTYTLTRLDAISGNLLHVVELPPEPGGTVLIDDHLFVACSAWDVVVEIDLTDNSIWQQYEIETSKHVSFLSREGSNVLVAPMLSGNNSMTKRAPDLLSSIPHTTEPPVDMSSALEPLPDHDLFRIVPGAEGEGTIEPVAVGLGTNLFMHAIHPDTGKLWCLNSEANNTGPDGHGAPALKVRPDLFTTSFVTVTTLPGTGQDPVATHDFTELVDHAVPNAAHTISKPYALAFKDDGEALVVGASTDNVRILDQDGVPVVGTHHFAVSDGAIPRGILYDATHDNIRVYCWGTNTVETYTDADITAGGAPSISGTVSLGYDPATADVKEGREIFFDARRSKFGNATCESCHVDGLFDFLVWENSPLPFDDKGPMFTQSLRGIADKRPYHWRGEQNDLVDFNGVFPDLFDAPELSTDPGDDFEKLQKYLFQLENPANPFEHEDRVVTNDAVLTRFDPPEAPHGALSAVNGQEKYQNGNSVNGSSCAHCHALPTGTTSDFFEDGFPDQHHRASFDSTAFNGMWRKDPKTRVDVQVDSVSSLDTRAPLGSGTSHAGLIPGVWEFVVDQFSIDPATEEEDIVFFVHQIDSGLAPSVHRARLLSSGTPSTGQWIEDYLIQQADAGHCDIAVFGTSTIGSPTQRRLRWYYVGDNEFLSEDPNVAAQDLTFFTTQAANDTGRNVFMGLPVGMARRWAVDFDGDDLLNVDERNRTTDTYDPDTDDDGFYDGVEVFNSPPSNPKALSSVPADTTAPVVPEVRFIWNNANTAKFIVETDELTEIEVDYEEFGVGPMKHTTSEGFKHLHTILLRDLEPSYATTLPGVTSYDREYEVTFRAFDQAGNVSPEKVEEVTTSSFITTFEQFLGDPRVERDVRVKQMTTYDPVAQGGGEYRLKFDVELADVKHPTSTLSNHVAVARVILTRGTTTQRWNTFVDVHVGLQAPTRLRLLNFQESSFNPVYLQPSDSYAVGSKTAGNNVSQIEIDLQNGLPGDVVQISIETAGEVPNNFNPNDPAFFNKTMFEFPATPAAARVSDGVMLP